MQERGKKPPIATIHLARVIMWIIDRGEEYNTRSRLKMRRAGRYWAQFEGGRCAYLLEPYWWNILSGQFNETCSEAWSSLEIVLPFQHSDSSYNSEGWFLTREMHAEKEKKTKGRTLGHRHQQLRANRESGNKAFLIFI